MNGEAAARPRMVPVLAAAAVDEFRREGSLILPRLLSSAECTLLVRRLAGLPPRSPQQWTKDWAATERFLFDLATRRDLLGPLRALLGEDVILWGASAIRRIPGQEHPWHTDIESAAPDGRFVSVWIGLQNTGSDTGLQIIPRSHRFGRPIQFDLRERGLARASDDQALALARTHDADATVTAPALRDGDAILFDGRLWHGSRNARPDAERIALLLQYAASDQPVYRLDPSRLAWPFRFLEKPRPPVIAVSGQPGHVGNHVVPPPEAQALPDLPACIHRLRLPLAEDRASGFRPYPQFHGVTPNVDHMSCHVSVLSPGRRAHPPHRHAEEELLIVLDGEAELAMAEHADDPAPKVEPAPAGIFVYYPAGRHHTIRNAGTRPVTYLMFRWRSSPAVSGATLPVQIVDLRRVAPIDPAAPVAARLLFEAPTAMLARLHAHVTEIQPGGGYDAHVDVHDVAIVMLSGQVETLGEKVGPQGVIYCPAGQPHGLRNAGAEPARYLVFEFHAPPSDRVPALLADLLARPVDAARFDASWYLSRNPDVAATGLDPYEHYRRCGAAEGRLPSEAAYRELTATLDFDAAWYLREYADVRAAAVDPLAHFVRFGYREGRSARPELRAAAVGPAESAREAGPQDPARRVAAYRSAASSRRQWIAVCTAIFGDYDHLTLPDRLDPEVDYVCFTDGPLEDHGVWKLREPPYRHADAVRMARYVKTHLAELFPTHEAAIWVDGNISFRGDVRAYADRVRREGASVGLIVHPHRRCVYDEAEACKRLNKDAPDLIDRQMVRYRRLGLGTDAGLYETGFFVVRLDHDEAARFLQLWWGEIEAFSRRDQLGVVWAARQAGVRICHLLPPGVSTRNHPDFRLLAHRRPHAPSRHPAVAGA